MDALSEFPVRWAHLLRPLSVALDFTYQGLSLHHLRVARAADSLNLVRGHSYYTYRILYRIPETREIAAWAGYHHERLDGRGYPFGLAAPEIDTGARLPAAADVFVALVEDRPYRAGLPRAGVEAVMREAVCSGALDAAAVDVLLGSCDELIGRLRRLGH